MRSSTKSKILSGGLLTLGWGIAGSGMYGLAYELSKDNMEVVDVKSSTYELLEKEIRGSSF